MNDRTTLADLGGFDSSEKTIPVLAGANMGHLTLKMNLSIRELIDMTRVYNITTINELDLKEQGLDAQRVLNEAHAKNLARYIVIGLVETNIRRLKRLEQGVSLRVSDLQGQLGKSEYSCLQPFVTNIRDCEPGGKDLIVERIEERIKGGDISKLDGVLKVVLTSKHIMSVVDGQHRRYAFDLVMKWLTEINNMKKYPAKGVFNPEDTLLEGEYLDAEIFEFWRQVLDLAIKESFVTVECHLGATAIQERQIFSDLNSKGKTVDLSQSLEYDSSDAVNVFIKKRLIEEEIIKFGTVVKDSSNWQEDEGVLLRKDLNPITALCMFGKASTKNFSPSMVSKRNAIAEKFWVTIQKVKGFATKGARTKTVAAQPVVLKAIARLAYELAHGKGGMQNEKNLGELWKAIETGKLDLSHNNDAWRSLILSAADRAKSMPGVSGFVHVPSGTNLDAGTYDEEHCWVRFGSKHNDIYPRIGDLIRYQLGFDPRPSVTRAIAKESKARKAA